MIAEPTTVSGSSRLAESAEACLDAGLCVLPAKLQEKRAALPSWKGYQDERPSISQLKRWLADGTSHQAEANCIVCGRVSGNLEMIDFDLKGEMFEPWREAVEKEAPGLIDRLVIESTPSGGRHVIYRCEGEICGNVKLAQRRIPAEGPETITVAGKEHVPRKDNANHWHVDVTMIETRDEGGLFLCAPSKGYDLIQGDLSQPPTITDEERETLLGCAWALNEVQAPIVNGTTGHSNEPSLAGSLRPGDDFNERGDIRSVLMKHDWTPVGTFDASKTSGMNEYWRRPGKTAGHSATLKDGVFYVFSTNAAPFEAGQGYSKFAVYTFLEHAGDFSAAASALAKQGHGIQSAVDLSSLQIADDRTQTDDPPQPQSVGELRRTYPKLRPPIIHGLLREGETMNVIASPKVGKSWLVLDLAIAIATGSPWFDHYRTEPSKVLIIDNELHCETSAFRIPKVADARGVTMDAIDDRVYIENVRGRLRDIISLRSYFEAMERGRYKVIVLDAFYRFMPQGGDENDNGMMAGIYNHIDLYAAQLGCSFILIHHASKGSQSSKAVTDVGAGAGSLSRATDTHLVLRPHKEKDTAVLDAAVRSWPPIEPLCLRWNFPVWTPDELLDPALLQNAGGRKGGRKKTAWTPHSFVKAFVTDEPATRSAIISRAVKGGVAQSSAGSFLRMANADGLVNRSGEGKRGDPYLYSVNSEPSKETPA